MPFNKEKASGESLIWLENSTAYKEFEGTILSRPKAKLKPPELKVQRRQWTPDRVIAIDGSNINHRIRNGFPGAEASLVLISAVRIDLSKLTSTPDTQIPSPRVFREMEHAQTVQAVLPGSNIVRQSVADDSPKRYFRAQIHQTLSSGYVSKEHETLLDTMRAISHDRESHRRCPIEGCESDVVIPIQTSSNH